MQQRSRGIELLILSIASCVLPAANAAAADQRNVLRDIEYAIVDGKPLRLDLHLPASAPRSPLIVWIHGGAWRSGSKSGMPLGSLVDEGYAIASVDYRLSTEARFPAQIHDIKAAIRFLRASGAEWKLPTEKIVIAGDSAGGHLAALVGLTNGHIQLEGTIGTHQQASSAVQGIMSFYGGANLTSILDQSTPHGLSVRVPALELLLGGQPKDLPALARLASPVYHIDSNDPPLLLLHGDQDRQMPINQAHELCGAYEEANLPVRFKVVHGAGHGGTAFYDAKRLSYVRTFLEKF
jgi:acetyl esterase/lipase